MTVFADLDLARRLETAEGHGNAAFVDAQARREPYSGAMRTTIAGTMAMFAGAGSPITQTFCLGIHEKPSDRDMDAIERFFTSRGSQVFHEVSPHAGVEVLGMLVGRGYKPIEISNVLYQELQSARGAQGAQGAESVLRVRQVEKHEAAVYGGISVRGWSEMPEVIPFIHGFALSSVEVASCFVAELGGEPIANAAMFMHGGVALLAGASTVPEARRQGAQQALLDARLRAAAASGCNLAMVVTAAGSASQRNSERNGFKVAYTRTKWQL
jgi:GNAT superfamily N-acetyltransferase